MAIVVLAVFVGTFVSGFLFAARMVKGVPMQLFMGFLLGAALCTMLAMTLLGVAFAGCLFYGTGGRGFH